MNPAQWLYLLGAGGSAALAALSAMQEEWGLLAFMALVTVLFLYFVKVSTELTQ